MGKNDKTLVGELAAVYWFVTKTQIFKFIFNKSLVLLYYNEIFDTGLFTLYGKHQRGHFWISSEMIALSRSYL